MLNVELHCHTRYSKDSLTSLESVLATCRKRGIDRIAITDHNTIAGAVRASQIDGGRVIVGEEIMTRQGELLALYVREEIPQGLTPREAIARLREQGAFIGVPHPFDQLRRGGWSLPALLDITPLVDAIETFNARCLWPGFNWQAQAFARRHGLPGTAGSDAHAAFEIGAATLLLPEFHDPASLRAALPLARRRGGLSPWWVRFASRYARMRNML